MSVSALERTGRARSETRLSLPRGDARWPWLLLVLLCLAQFMVALDATVVNLALPSISKALDFGSGQQQWVVTAYLLCTGGLTLLGGRAADLFGRRRMLLGGLTLFSAASLASALAPNATFLIISRAAQGIGAAFLTPAALSTLTTTYEGPRRNAALSAWGAIGAGGFAAGLLVGGMVTTWLSWHWIFYINLPVGALALLAVPFLVPPDREPNMRRARLGGSGSLILTAGLIATVYGITASSPHGWTSAQTISGLAAGAALLLVFAALETRARQPLVPRRVWRARSLTSSVAAVFGATGVLAGSLFIATFFIQQELHTSALRTGLYYLPFAAVIGVAAHLGPRLLAAAGSRVIATTGLATVAGGTLLLAVAPSHAHYASDLLPGLLILAAGTGLSFVAASVTAMAEIEADDAGAASGLLTTGHEFGGAFGIAVISAAASSGSGPLRIAHGHRPGFAVAATAAAALAAFVAAAMPGFRPAPDAAVSLH